MEVADILEIEGDMGEGGGSILRLGAGFSVLFRRPVHFSKVRANRSKPGLRLQHREGLLAVQRLTGGRITDVEVGTTELTLSPGEIFLDRCDVGIKTAGSVGLLSQTLQNASLGAGRGGRLTVEVRGGGTFGTGAPDPHYINHVTYHYFGLMGYRCNLHVEREGFFPKGGARATLTIDLLEDPSRSLRPLPFVSMGNLQKITGDLVAAEGLRSRRVTERMALGVREALTKEAVRVANHDGKAPKALSLKSVPLELEERYVESEGDGAGINLRAHFDTGVVLGSGSFPGQRGLPAEKLGHSAASSLLRQVKSGSTVDEHLADQIVPLLYLLPESCPIIVPEITSHMQTNIDLLNLFHPRRYEIEELEGARRFFYY